MKKITLLILLSLSVSAFSQNNIVYVRYDMTQGNASLVVSKINSIIDKTKGIFIVYYSNAQTPIVCKDKEDWIQLKTNILSQQASPDYYPEEDFKNLNKIFEDYFGETVSLNSGMTITGDNDDKWTCTFILSDQMLSDDEEVDLICRIISVNELSKRLPITIWSYNENDIKNIKIEELNYSELYNYFVD